MSELKLCKDCRHYESSKCQAVNGKTDPVSGDPYEGFHLAIFARNALWLCGPDAKWFEPKAPELPEGWRWLIKGQLLTIGDYDTAEAGYTIDLDWLRNNCPYANRNFRFRRRITPELEQCPDGHEAYVVATVTVDGRGHRVTTRVCSWTGPWRKTVPEAVAAWNAVMRAYRLQLKSDIEAARNVVESAKNKP